MLTLSHIKRYIELGFVVHPCCPADHHCMSPGKIPFDPVRGLHMEAWQEHPQFSFEQWRVWVDYDSSINIGVLCGSPSRLVFIDIDDEEANGKYSQLQRGRKESPWAFRTGRGLRYVFRSTEEPVRSCKINAGNGSYLEVLGDGRQSVLPPSSHPSGREYTWTAGSTPLDFECSDAPAWIEGGDTGDMDAGETNWKELVNSPTPEGGRNETLAKLCGHLLAPTPLPPAEVRLWLNAYNIAFCKPKLSDEELNTIIDSISKREEASEGDIRYVMKLFNLRYRDTAIEYILQDPSILER